MKTNAATRGMVERLIQIASINSGTTNQAGVATVVDQVEPWLAEIADQVSRVPMPSVLSVGDDGQQHSITFADALVAVRRPDAKRRVLLCIHLDTVYGQDHPFQNVSQESENLLRGPGVSDAKGGVVVLIEGLRRFEQAYGELESGACEVGWEVVLTPDEEIGSLASHPLLCEAATRSQIGLVYEPTLPDGTLIASRKGSGNFTMVVHGRSAHAGREIDRGRNAITALCELFLSLQALQTPDGSVTVNLGKIQGGGAVNVVPDLAVGRFNIRVLDRQIMRSVQAAIESIIARKNEQEGIKVSLHGGFTSPPKPLDDRTARLLTRIVTAGQSLGLDIQTASSGGVCDGNKLAAAGLPNIDTMGPRGGNIHSDQEYVLIDSLDERAQLTCEVMMDFARHPEGYFSSTTPI